MIEKQSKSYFIFTIVLASFCLRIVITGVGSVLGLIQDDFALSSGEAGILTTLPLLAFAAFSPLVERICRAWGEGKTLLLGLFVITAGTVLRSVGGVWGLYAGTAILGAGVAVGNVLLPAIIKAKFPEQMGAMTGVYTVAMSLASALSLGVSAPLAESPGFGWQRALGMWGIMLVITILAWWPLKSMNLGSGEKRERKKLLRLPLTWSIIIFFGMTSMLFYAMIGWLPTILQSGGMESAEAGFVTSLFQLAGIPASFLAPIWAGRSRDQRLVIALGCALNIIGVVMLILSNSQGMMIAAAVLLGFANGSNFSLSLALFGFRTTNAADAARLSGVAQSIGYLIAATGPFAMGWIYDLIPNWSICLLYLLIANILALLVGLRAGADRTI